MAERYIGKTAFFAVFLFILGVYASTALASISVSPIRLDLSEFHTKDVVRISNQEAVAKSYQVEVVEWSQTERRQEVYTPTEALLAVPPLFTLQPGEDQLVRIGMMEDADDKTEQSFRVFITEIAPPNPEEPETSGVSMRLQIGIPVFVASKALPVSNFSIIDSMNIDNKLFLQFRNSGNTHVKVSEVEYKAPGLEEAITTSAAMYVLAGQTGYLPVPSPDGRAVGTVKVVTDSLGTLEYELPVAP